MGTFTIEPALFAAEVEDAVTARDCSYVEAILLFQEKMNMEPETVAGLVRACPDLKDRLQAECEDNRTVVRSETRLF